MDIAPDNNPLTHYVVVRPDLPIGLLAAQVAHAAGESSPGNLPSGTHAVILQASKNEIEALSSKLKEGNVPHVLVRDCDLQNEVTALGIEPALKSKIRPWVSSFALLRGANP